MHIVVFGILILSLTSFSSDIDGRRLSFDIQIDIVRDEEPKLERSRSKKVGWYKKKAKPKNKSVKKVRLDKDDRRILRHKKSIKKTLRGKKCTKFLDEVISGFSAKKKMDISESCEEYFKGGNPQQRLMDLLEDNIGHLGEVVLEFFFQIQVRFFLREYHDGLSSYHELSKGSEERADTERYLSSHRAAFARSIALGELALDNPIFWRARELNRDLILDIMAHLVFPYDRLSRIAKRKKVIDVYDIIAALSDEEKDLLNSYGRLVLEDDISVDENIVELEADEMVNVILSLAFRQYLFYLPRQQVKGDVNTAWVELIKPMVFELYDGSEKSLTFDQLSDPERYTRISYENGVDLKKRMSRLERVAMPKKLYDKIRAKNHDRIIEILYNFAYYFFSYLNEQSIRCQTKGMISHKDLVKELPMDKRDFIKRHGSAILENDLKARALDLDKPEDDIIVFMFGLAMNFYKQMIPKGHEDKSNQPWQNFVMMQAYIEKNLGVTESGEFLVKLFTDGGSRQKGITMPPDLILRLRNQFEQEAKYVAGHVHDKVLSSWGL